MIEILTRKLAVIKWVAYFCFYLNVGQFLSTGSQTVALMIFLIIKNVESS